MKKNQKKNNEISTASQSNNLKESRATDNWQRLTLPVCLLLLFFVCDIINEGNEFYKKNEAKPKESVADKFGDLAKLRNIITHEYLDITWKKIQNFISEAEKLYPQFIEKLEVLVKKI